MGFRSWLTPIEDLAEWEEFSAALEVNDYSHGLDYAIVLDDAVEPFPQGLIAAWSGDGNLSLGEGMPAQFRDRTALLDNYPAFQDPRGLGTLMYGDEVAGHFGK